ncbi:hypothetical protein LUZ60_005537 [Juncus effusus]|nr:hypothetical protein LUZ60_005537 [Juncus effusus]
MLTNILQSCVSLEFLSLKKCGSLEMVKFIGDNLKLQKLVMIDCRGVYDMEISAPKLESFLYYGVVSFSHVFDNVSKLNDAYFCSVGLEDYDTDQEELFRVLSDFAHVKVLTLCCSGLMSLVVEQEVNEDDFPLELRNLQELQLIMDSLSEEHLFCIFSFFHLCPSPFLEKLLISFPYTIDKPIDMTYAITVENDTPDISFDNLKWIQITNFEGSMLELKLVKFLLENSPVLESLILVIKERDNMSKDSLFLRIVQGQLSVLQKASKNARIVLCGPLDHEFMINPLHRMLYHEKKYRAGTTVHLEYPSTGGEEILLDQQFM